MGYSPTVHSGADKLRAASASADDQSWESLAFGVIMWLCVHIFGVQDFYRSFSEHIRAMMLKIFRCQSEILSWSNLL